MSAKKTIEELVDEHGTTDQIRPDSARLFSHLQKPKPKNCASTFEATKSREYWCRVCKHRVTVSPDELDEYGHGRDCPHRLEVDR
jgi:hypothetical protein